MIILKMPTTRVIDYRRSIFTKNFWFYSDILECWSVIPKGFQTDWESVPVVRGTSKVAGAIHDYLCRIDSDPVVSKKVAADVYLEVMTYRKISYIRRYTKYWVVRGAPNYFHKLRVLDELQITDEEIVFGRKIPKDKM